MKAFIKAGIFSILVGACAAAETVPRVKVALIGMTHGHVNGWLRAEYDNELELVGLHETNAAVAEKYRERYGLDEALFFEDLDRMLDERKPEAAWVFTSTYAHEAAVEACAKRGIHVIVEKPLAVSLESAERMAALAREHDIHLLTNLETTWYPSLQEAMLLLEEGGSMGEITKIVSHFGHMGPVEIQCPSEFLEWLTDPVLNGGGASADFGCYGANIITRIMGDQRPLSVTAVFQTHKPDVYPDVDDDATIILEYPGVQGIIQASWDWPYSRKDIHIYGRSGVIRTIDTTAYDLRLERRDRPEVKSAEPASATAVDAVKYYAAVLRGEIDPAQSFSSLKTNLIAVEIIDAARKSARTGERVVLETR